MDSKKFPELKKVEQVKVRVSKNGKWLTHILSEQGLMITFSMNYYRSILKGHRTPLEETPIVIKKMD